jgi:alpha-N-acetylglucosamine transferase
MLLAEGRAGPNSNYQATSHLELLRARRRREAYATLLHTDEYVCGAIVAAQSIRLTGSQKDLVALVASNITPNQRESLQLAGWKLYHIERIRNPKAKPEKYNEWNYSKFRLWQLTQYDKVIFIDADLLVLQNMDFLFDMPELSATGNDQSYFNSGVMVIEPSNCTFNYLMDNINNLESYNGGDQGYLNEIFPTWYRISSRLNYLKHFWTNGEKERDEWERDMKNRLFSAVDPPLLHVIHYLGTKPWLCYRDYDCNWLSAKTHKYASDPAHARWWEVHDSMQTKLQDKCLLLTKQKAKLEYTRKTAEAAGFEDGHWRINISDPRQNTCSEPGHCNWQEMLVHWGEPSTQRRLRTSQMRFQLEVKQS